jgi:hypothetical protein
MNRPLPPRYSGDIVYGRTGLIHIGKSGDSLCGEVTQARPAVAFGVAQSRICPRCWQLWRSKSGDDVRDAWKEPS